MLPHNHGCKTFSKCRTATSKTGDTEHSLVPVTSCVCARRLHHNGSVIETVSMKDKTLPEIAGAASGPDLKRLIWLGEAASASHSPPSLPHTPAAPYHSCLTLSVQKIVSSTCFQARLQHGMQELQRNCITCFRADEAHHVSAIDASGDTGVVGCHTSKASLLVLTSWHRLRSTSFLTPSLKLLSRATPSSPIRTGSTTAVLLRLCLSCRRPTS